MKCDKCQNEINESHGYITIMTSFEAKYSFRDGKGILVTREACATKRETKRHCSDCLKEAQNEGS